MSELAKGSYGREDEVDFLISWRSDPSTAENPLPRDASISGAYQGTWSLSGRDGDC